MVLRRVILLGTALTALLVIIGLTGFAIWRTTTMAQDRFGQANAAYASAASALSAVRNGVFVAAVLTRDYLLDSDPSHASQYQRQYKDVKRQVEASFQTLLSQARDDGTRQTFEQLQGQWMEFADPTEEALNWSVEQKHALGAAFLRERVREREEVLDLARQVESLLASNYSRDQQNSLWVEREFRVSLGWTTLLALIFGAMVTGFTLIRVFKLERKSLAAETELRRLSGRLRTAQEQERKFLSRELHDQVGQMLTGVRMELAGIARSYEREHPELLASGPIESRTDLVAKIARAKATVEQSLGVVRNISMLLRPSMLDDLGLTPAITWLGKEMSRTSGIRINLDLDQRSDNIPDAQRTCLYRLVQEAVTNAVKHSSARSIDIVLKLRKDAVTAVVSDDGRGFEPTARKSGLGLLGMEERVKELGGTLQIASSFARGTRVEIQLPLPRGGEGENDTNYDRGRSRDRESWVETFTRQD